MIRRILLGVVAVLVVLFIAVAAMVGPAFMGNLPPVDGAILPGGATTVVDGYVSMFILPAGEGQVALVDCGDDSNGQAVLAALAKRKLTPDAVTAIFLTHGHPDHVAGCHLFPKAKVYAFDGDIRLAAGDVRALGPLPRMIDMPKDKAIAVTDALVDEHPVTVGDLTVTPYAVPGHTAGSAAFLANGVLYLGDSASGASDGTVKAAPWVFSDSSEQNRASIAALAARLKKSATPVAVLAFAHTGPINGSAALDTLHSRRRRTTETSPSTRPRS